VPANLVSAESVSKTYDIRTILDTVSLGVGDGERIGVVGPNGGGKSTLLRILAKHEEPDSGRVSHSRGLEVTLVDQHDDGGDDRSVRERVVGDMAEHEWASIPVARELVAALLDGIGWEASTRSLSGGERRRVELAAALLTDPDLLMLDEPTNHLDIDGISWLAGHLRSRRFALVVVTHDRWFLDAVATTTWDVAEAGVTAYDGGYAAHVLAKAERERAASVTAAKRSNLLRKELAWLQRGAPARTSKPKFRIDVAEDLIANEPPPRDSLTLARFATQRLGKQVVDLEDVTVRFGAREVLDDVTIRLVAGRRIGIVGRNGSGKSTLLGLMAGELEPTAGRVIRGKTVHVAHLSQGLGELDKAMSALATIESVRSFADTVDYPDRPVSAAQLLERFGFGGGRMMTRVGDLSGGERRRLALLKLLMAEPNVLLLDEPTNDLDIDTLTILEDYLDSWPGTLVVVSHDRYLLERMSDEIWGVRADKSLVLLPRGIEDYLDQQARRSVSGPTGSASAPPSGAGTSGLGAAELRKARKALTTIERTMAKLRLERTKLEEQQLVSAQDYEKLIELGGRHRDVVARLAQLEDDWLVLAERVDG
jgi:ATP-binding cassette subfamily F protein uup